MSKQTLPMTGGPVSIAGAISLETTDAGVKPWRLVHEDLELFEEALRPNAALPVGVRITLVSDTSSVAVNVTPQPVAGDAQETPGQAYALHVDGKLFAKAQEPITAETIRFTDLPEGEHRLEIYPDHHYQPELRSVEIDDGASARAFEDHRPKWTVYGSSITQCGRSRSGDEVWPVLVANMFDVNLTCLGYGGNCHLEPIVAKMIRDTPADYISACVGINIQGGSTLSPRTFRAAVIGFIDRVRENHPTTPMVIVSPICSPPREETDNAVGLSLTKMREIISGVVELMKSRGDKHLAYADGLEVFGHDFVDHMPDKLHPDAEGIHVLADQYAKVVMPKLGLEPRQSLAPLGA